MPEQQQFVVEASWKSTLERENVQNRGKDGLVHAQVSDVHDIQHHMVEVVAYVPSTEQRMLGHKQPLGHGNRLGPPQCGRCQVTPRCVATVAIAPEAVMVASVEVPQAPDIAKVVQVACNAPECKGVLSSEGFSTPLSPPALEGLVVPVEQRPTTA
eukprot:857112-Lingulodinium_polyedra.AAC.1